MRKGLFVTLCVLTFMGSSDAWCKKKLSYPAECSQHDPSVTQAICGVRLEPNAPLMPQCAGRQGEDYRLCVARLPSDQILAQRKQQQEEAEAIHVRLGARLKDAGINLPSDALMLPTSRDAVLALGPTASADDMMRAYYDARAEEAKAVQSGLSEIVDPDDARSIKAEQEAKRRGDELEKSAKKSAATARAEGSCLRSQLFGTSQGHVYACLGQPDSTNSDLYTDQLVYPDGTLVYIDRRTGLVENVQWTH